MMFDLLIRDGVIVDGTRSARFRGDIGIRGDRITAVGSLGDAEAAETRNAAGCVVAPGFVDVHNHSDGWMLKQPLQSSKTLQGFTSEVLLLDGIGYAPVNEQTWREWVFYLRALDGLRLDEYEGWNSLEEFMNRLDRQTTQNALMHVPYANVRSMYCGFGAAAPDEGQQRQIESEIRSGMEAGAVGLSSGLDYIVQCFASTDELVAACRVVAEYGGLYATHIRYKLGMIPALNEALAIARKSGVALHVSHLKAIRGSTAEEILAWVDKAAREVPLSFDVYPYMPGCTMLNYLLPYDVWIDGPIAALGKLNQPEIREAFRERLASYKLDLDGIQIAWLPGKENSGAQGMLLSEYVASTGKPAEEALLNLLIEERLAVLCVYLEGNDDLIDPFLKHDLYMMGSDGILAEGGMVHPRQFGSAARLLGRCVRERALFSLEDAVYKLSGHAAEKFGLKDRGQIREGAFADLVIFDEERVADNATYKQPQQAATGIRDVLVNGCDVVRDSEPLSLPADGGLPGRFLKFNVN